jgi:hypothetical protein
VVRTGIRSKRNALALLVCGWKLKTVEDIPHCNCQLLIRDESSMTLTVGAGGSIKQTIIKDKADPRIWDVASSRLINVQSANSALFELVTGLAVPPTPVTYQVYLSVGSHSMASTRNSRLLFREHSRRSRQSRRSMPPRGIGKLEGALIRSIRHSAHSAGWCVPTASKCSAETTGHNYWRVLLPALVDCRLRPCGHCICEKCA